MKMKNLLLALIAFASLALFGCEPVQQSSSQGSVQVGAPAEEKTVLPEVPGDGKWPPAAKGAVTPAGNLLAKNYVIVFDGSGSMKENACGEGQRKIDSGKTALREFAQTIPADANVGLVVFDDSGLGERVAIGLGAAHRARFLAEIEKISVNGGTPLRSAITLGGQMLGGQAQRQSGYGEYHLVVVTDGEANAGESPTDIVMMLAKTPVIIHTIGFCIGTSHSLNKAGMVLYHEAKDLASLRKGLQEVLAESSRFDPTTFDGKK